MTFIGSLNFIDTARLKRGEITLEQAAGIARANTESGRAALRVQMKSAERARKRTRAWLGIDE